MVVRYTEITEDSSHCSTGPLDQLTVWLDAYTTNSYELRKACREVQCGKRLLPCVDAIVRGICLTINLVLSRWDPLVGVCWTNEAQHS